MSRTLLVLPRASRYDLQNQKVLAGPARDFVDSVLGAGSYDVQYAADYNPAGYSRVILTGAESAAKMFPGRQLTAVRGYVLDLGTSKVVATFWPQDCVDLRDHEANTTDEEDDAAGTGKDDAPTKRANYRFWFQRDVAKLFNTPRQRFPWTYQAVPNKLAAQFLRSAVDSTVYFDSETHPDTDTLQCFSFAINDGPVYTVGIYDWRGYLLPDAVELMAALARAFSRNKIVAHNISFDLLFLAMFHGVPFGPDIEDTMLIGHRIWPEAEKSLAHAISLWTNLPYHKDEGGTWHPRNFQQYDTLCRYNSKDVHTLREVHLSQRAYIAGANDPGLAASVAQVNESIFPYLYTSLHGLPLNTAGLLHYKRERRFAAQQFGRIISTLAGYDLNPNSPLQTSAYFVEGLGYPVQSVSDSGRPSVDEATLYKYLLKFKNPIIRAILKYKRARKVAGELGFKVWSPIKGR